MIRIAEYTSEYHEQVIRHILAIQNDEFHLGLRLEDQPDLDSIETSYHQAGGNFWIAVDEHDVVIGTIAIFNLGNNNAYLRKMFIKPAWRGKEKGVSMNLLNILLQWTEAHGYERIYLETISVFKAAVIFYSRNGFKKIDRSELPPNFHIIKVAEFFFVRELNPAP